MAVYKFTCEFGHKGLVERPIARCPHCGAPAMLSSDYRAIGVDEREWARLADVCERTPGLADVFATILQAIHNYTAVEQIKIEDLSPSTMVARTGVIVLELMTPVPDEVEAA